MNNDLLSTLFSIAATYTDDKARQSELVNSWLAGQARSLPKRRDRRA